MRKEILVGAFALAIIAAAGVAVWGPGSLAAGTKFSFTARGVVTGVDLANKSIEVDVTKAVPTNAKEAMEGENIEFKIGSAKIVKVANGLDKPVTYKNFAIGQEIGMKGTAYNDDTYSLSFARIHDRSFTVIGTVEEHDQSARTIKVEVITSSYKPTTYKAGASITMKYFDGNTTFYNKNLATPEDFTDLGADHQKVKVMGTVTGSGTWEIKTLVDEFAG